MKQSWKFLFMKSKTGRKDWILLQEKRSLFNTSGGIVAFSNPDHMPARQRNFSNNGTVLKAWMA